MKGIVIYQSKYGATRQYAQWLASGLGFAITTPETISAHALNEADVLVMGTSVYIGKMLLKSWMQKNIEILRKKRLFLFVVCGTPATEKEKIDTIVAKNLPDVLVGNCEVFFLPGSLHLEKLSFLDKMAINFAAWIEKDANQKRRMLLGYDDVQKSQVTSLSHAISGVMQPEI